MTRKHQQDASASSHGVEVSETKSTTSGADTVSARRILGLALPALGVLSATPLYLLLDTAIIGHLGAHQLAALAAGTTVQSVVTTQLTFLSYGTTARASRRYGQGDTRGAVAEGVQATWVALAVGVVLAAIVVGGAPIIGRWLTGDPEVAVESARWLRVACLGVPLTLIVMAGNGWMRGIQDTRRPLYFTLAGVIPGAAVLPLAVHQWGLVGSAVANLLGMILTSSCFLIALVTSHRGGGWEAWRPQWPVIRNQLVLGRDLIVRSAAFQVSFLSAAAVASRCGAASLGAHQILLQLWNFISLVLDSLAIAAQALTGAALGSGRARIARSVGRAVTRYSTTFGVAIAAVMTAGAGLIPRLFTSDQAVLDTIAVPWWLMCVMVVCGGAVFALDGVLLGASDAGYLRNITLLSVLCGFLPGVWLAHLTQTGLTGIWCGLVAFIGIRLVAVVWRFRSMRWARTGSLRESVSASRSRSAHRTLGASRSQEATPE